MPNDRALNYNYSLFLNDTEGEKVALDFLENLSDELKNSLQIRLRIIILKNGSDSFKTLCYPKE